MKEVKECPFWAVTSWILCSMSFSRIFLFAEIEKCEFRGFGVILSIICLAEASLGATSDRIIGTSAAYDGNLRQLVRVAVKEWRLIRDLATC